jgi:hypothetical protein
MPRDRDHRGRRSCRSLDDLPGVRSTVRATVRSGPPAISNRAARYPGCSQARRHECVGRPACCCPQCHAADIRADARQRLARGAPAELIRTSLRELLALEDFRQDRRRQIADATPVFIRCSECPKIIAASPFGRRRITCSKACRTARWYRRKMAAEGRQVRPRRIHTKDELAPRDLQASPRGGQAAPTPVAVPASAGPALPRAAPPAAGDGVARSAALNAALGLPGWHS